MHLVLILAAAPLLAQTRDSAGIRIVESPVAIARERTAVRVADRPTLQLGVESGDPNQQFNQVIAATRLGDGSIAVADGGSGEIRIFDATGRFVRKVGRKGQGPGEFVYLTDVRVLGRDSLVALDATGRLTVFSPSGNVARTVTVQGGPAGQRGLGFVRGALADGRFVAYRVARTPPPPVEAVTRDTLLVGVYGGDGAYAHNVGDFLGIERRLHSGGSMPGPDGRLMAAFSVKGVPFARETYLRAGGERLYVGNGDRYEIRAFAPNGTLEQIIRIDEPARPVTPDIIARHRAEPRRRDSASRPNVDPKIDAALYPKTLPAYAGFRVDGAQRLWVRDYPVPGEPQPRWRVFDRNGALLGSVLTPPGVEVLEIGTDYLLGVWLDADDVEYVRMYAVSPAM